MSRVSMFCIFGIILLLDACSSGPRMIPPPPPDLNSGLSLIPQDSGFIFASRKVTSPSQGDIIFINSNGPRFVRDTTAFIHNAGEKNLDALDMAPDLTDTLYETESLCTPGMSYYVITKDGKHYAKFRISTFKYTVHNDPTSGREGILIDWVYNVNESDGRF